MSLCQCVNEDAIGVSDIKCTNQTPGALTPCVTYQHLCLFILCVGPFSLTEEGGGLLIQVCLRHWLSLPLGQFGQLLVQQGLLALKAKVWKDKNPFNLSVAATMFHGNFNNVLQEWKENCSWQLLGCFKQILIFTFRVWFVCTELHNTGKRMETWENNTAYTIFTL